MVVEWPVGCSWNPWSDHRGARIHGAYLVNSTRMARDLAIEGEGIALCPDYMVQADLDEGRLEHVLPGTSGPQLDIHALYLGQRRLARRTRAFLDFIAANLMAGSAGL